MWFKNLRIYKFTSPLDSVLENLEEKLSSDRFKELPKTSKETYGWVSPVPEGQVFSHTVNGFTVLCLMHEFKDLQAEVINRAMTKRIEAIEKKEGRKVFRKEKLQLKDDVILELLPKAFIKQRKHFAYIDHKNGLIVINTGSQNVAEVFLSTLRNTLGSLPVVPLDSSNVSEVLTQWLTDGHGSNHFELESEVELYNPKEDGNIVKCKGQDLGSLEIDELLKAGKMVIKLAVAYKDRITFTINEKHQIGKLKFSDIILEKANECDAESVAQQFDQDFAVMSLELSKLFRDLFAVFGSIKDIKLETNTS